MKVVVASSWGSLLIAGEGLSFLLVVAIVVEEVVGDFGHQSQGLAAPR